MTDIAYTEVSPSYITQTTLEGSDSGDSKGLGVQDQSAAPEPLIAAFHADS